MAAPSKGGGSKHSDTASNASRNRKRATSRVSRMLSESEIVSLRQDKRETIEKARALKRAA